jgi:excisionase family DNA binding protein
MDGDLLSVDDVTRILRISKGTAQRWCRDHRLPAAKIGKEYRIRKADLDEWYEGKLREQAVGRK